ncbi:MAG: LLM class flavin-dependent oxidoreductase [Steroidobacteraceae bacterium]
MTVKCGIYNMAWNNWDDTINIGMEAEKAGHRVQFFTDQLVAYLFGDDAEKLFGKEDLGAGPLQHNGKYIPNFAVMGMPREGMGMGLIDPTIAMPVIADKTQKMELFLGAIDAVRHGPTKLAQTFMTLDHACKGRAFFALGGSEMKQISPYGYSRIGSAKKLEEALIIMRMMFDHPHDRLHFKGEHWSITGGSLPLVPYDGKTPPRLIVAPGMPWETVGKYADGMLTNTKRHPGRAAGFKRDMEAMRAAAKAAGRDPSKLTATACPQVLMHDDPNELRRLASSRKLKFQTMLTGKEKGEQWKEYGFTHPLGDEFGYARKLKPEAIDIEMLRPAIDKVPPEAVMEIGFHCGTVDQVAAQLKPYIDAGLEYLGIVDYATFADNSPQMQKHAAENMAKLVAKLQSY